MANKKWNLTFKVQPQYFHQHRTTTNLGFKSLRTLYTLLINNKGKYLQLGYYLLGGKCCDGKYVHFQCFMDEAFTPVLTQLCKHCARPVHRVLWGMLELS